MTAHLESWTDDELMVMQALREHVSNPVLREIWRVAFGSNRTAVAIRHKATDLGIRFVKTDLAEAMAAVKKMKGVRKELRDSLMSVLSAEPATPIVAGAEVAAERMAERRERLVEKEKVTEFQYQQFVARCSAAAEAGLHVPDWVADVPKSRQNKPRVIPTLFLSDTHFGEVVDPAEVNGVNAYNTEIGTMRLKELGKRVIKVLREYTAGVTVDGIQIAVGGDIFSGMIHEELARTNDMELTDSIIYWTGQLVAFFEMMREEFGKIDSHMVVGNHGRLDQKPVSKHRVKRNFEYLLYNFIAAHFANDPNVNIVVPESPTTIFTTYKVRTRLEHGDDYRGGNAVAGKWSPVKRGEGKSALQFIQLSDEHRFHQLAIGHFHQWGLDEGLIMNGCLKGYDEYAFRNRYPCTRPVQMLWLTTPEHGVTDYRKIFCDTGDEKW